MAGLLTVVSLRVDPRQHRIEPAHLPIASLPGYEGRLVRGTRQRFASSRSLRPQSGALPRSPIGRCCRACSEFYPSHRAQPSAQGPIRDDVTHPRPARSPPAGRRPLRESARDEWRSRLKCTPVPMGALRRLGHGGPMTVLAAFDPQTLDRAPVRFAVAAAKLADVPLVLASVRASVAPAPSAQEDVIGEELERLRADITYGHGIEVRTRAVKALPP